MKPWWLGLAGMATLGSVLADFVPHEADHALFWWHTLPAFDLLYGLAGCLGIIVLSKALGARWLQRPESYYDENAK